MKNILPRSPALKLVALLSAVALALFILCGVLVVAGLTQANDAAILSWINSQSRPWLDTFFVSITDLGGVVAVTALTAAVFGVLLYKKQPRKALLVATSIGGVALIGVILKGLVERPRPDLWEWLVTESYFSFPSGHAVASSALALCIIALCWNTRWRTLAIVFGATYTVLIGLSRLYLGVHYPTDIIGGWLLSVAWVAFATIVIFGYVRPRYKNEKPLA